MTKNKTIKARTRRVSDEQLFVWVDSATPTVNRNVVKTVEAALGEWQFVAFRRYSNQLKAACLIMTRSSQAK